MVHVSRREATLTSLSHARRVRLRSIYFSQLAAFEPTLVAERAQQLWCPYYESAEWVDQLPGSSRNTAQQQVGLGWVALASLRSVQFPLYLNKERDGEISL